MFEKNRDAQEKYDELENIIITLKVLIDEVLDEDYKEDIRDILWRAEDEIELYEEILQKEYEEEEKEMERQYRRSVI